MKIVLRLSLIMMLTFSGVQSSNAHGGGLDWQGGHNCRVGSCAGTYHCHQARAGICAQASSSNSSNPRIKKIVTPICVSDSQSDLSKGNIALIQNKLKALGYSVGAIDGVIGSQTIKALNSYESDNVLVKSTRGEISWESILLLGANCE